MPGTGVVPRICGGVATAAPSLLVTFVYGALIGGVLMEGWMCGRLTNPSEQLSDPRYSGCLQLNKPGSKQCCKCGRGRDGSLPTLQR